MSINLERALYALSTLSEAMGPRLPGPASTPRANVDFGTVAVAEYDRLRGAMKVTFEFDHVNDIGETEMDATGHLGGVSIRVRAVRPATNEELIARIERLKKAVAARTAEAVPEVLPLPWACSWRWSSSCTSSGARGGSWRRTRA